VYRILVIESLNNHHSKSYIKIIEDGGKDEGKRLMRNTRNI